MSKIRTTALDAVIASVPLNSTAGSVTARGTHWDPKLKESNQLHQDHPPEMKRPRPGGPDFTGIRFGRFRVLGLLSISNPKKPAAWVVRCACGMYETRKAKAIRNPKNVDDCCRACRRLQQLKRDYERLGSKPASDFFTRPK